MQPNCWQFLQAPQLVIVATEVGVRVGVKASSSSASHDKWLPDKWQQLQLATSNPHHLDWAIFSAHCGCRCRFRFPSSQLFCNAACQVGCGLSAVKGQIRSPLSLPLFPSLPLFSSLYLLSRFAVYLFLISISFFAISPHDSFLVNAMLVTCSHLFSGFAGGGNGVWLGEVGVHSALLLITWRKRRLITKLRAFVVYISVIQSEGQEC